MAFQTPQKPLPGAFFNTPAVSQPSRPAFPVFRPSSLHRGGSFSRQDQGQAQALAQAQSQAQAPGLQQQLQQQSQGGLQSSQVIEPIHRAADTINRVLKKDQSFPEVDRYVTQAYSSEYIVPNDKIDSAWAPFQRTKLHEIPDKVFEQWNRAEVSTQMGLFAELNHAWVTIDNALYLWDYTDPNPEIIGFEEQNNGITAVKLVIPRKGVFVNTITHLLVVATTAELLLLGIESSVTTSGVRSIILYNTRMSLSTRGTNIKNIEGSAATGRIFYTNDSDTDVWELTYQQEEKWFSSRCGKINHSDSNWISPIIGPLWAGKDKKTILEIVVDDTRRLLYTLSSDSCIRTYLMEGTETLRLLMEKKKTDLLSDISHMIPQSALITNAMQFVSISPISAQEGLKFHLMALTSTGCRFYISATSGHAFGPEGPPRSMAVQHIKFPPPMDSSSAQSNQQYGSVADQNPQADVHSTAFRYSRKGLRYSPGLFFNFIQKESRDTKDMLFMSAPDTARIAAPRQDSSLSLRFYEVGCWLDINSAAEAIGLVTRPFAATNTPQGFGNELAVQYDEPAAEIAILTNNGIHIIRRRRLVDIFAAAMRTSDGTIETEVKKFMRLFGRDETTATALAVACGQGNDVSPTNVLNDTRVAVISNPDTLEAARKCFVEYGGKPSVTDNGVPESIAQPFGNVIPSSRHEGLALYMARLIRSVWKAPVVTITPLGPGVSVLPTVRIEKLKSVQDNLLKLHTFLLKNQSFIEGLAGPESLKRVATKQEEIALQGEHQALYSLRKLNSNIIEGISFVQMLFDERVDEIFTSLDEQSRMSFRDLTYEGLFSTHNGKELAKILVKAIVNRNIANGSNVDTVADALRRRCGSFCSADDVIIFKAQEQLKKASEVGSKTELGRTLLNESLRLFLQVSGALSFENLTAATNQFADLEFFAGAISLALLVAQEHDRGNSAMSWINEGQPRNDSRAAVYDFRVDCYGIVHRVIEQVEFVTSQQPEYVDGRPSIAATKRAEAYTVIHDSDDELFHFDLYDWYLRQGLVDKLLSTNSPYVVQYLTREARESVERADLLWRFHVYQNDFFSAAIVQHELAQGQFQIPLARRIEYLSRAKANASTNNSGVGRQTRQVLLHQISELLDVANIQDEILHRIRGDERISDDRKQEAIEHLNNQVLSLTELFNLYSDPGQYYDINLLILESSNHRVSTDIDATWEYYIAEVHQKFANDPDASAQQPYEAVINIFREMSNRLKNSEATFSPHSLIPMIEGYALEYQNGVGPANWVIDLFIQVGWPFETILQVLQGMWFGGQNPWTGRSRNILADHMIYTCEQWYQECIRSNKRLFGSEDNANEIVELLHMLTGSVPADQGERAKNLMHKIQRSYQ